MVASEQVQGLAYSRGSRSLHVGLRRKIDSIIARGGGEEDPDAPGILEETKYWCLAEESRDDNVRVEPLGS